jgi:hypothetical protein
VPRGGTRFPLSGQAESVTQSHLSVRLVEYAHFKLLELLWCQALQAAVLTDARDLYGLSYLDLVGKGVSTASSEDRNAVVSAGTHSEPECRTQRSAHRQYAHQNERSQSAHSRTVQTRGRQLEALRWRFGCTGRILGRPSTEGAMKPS